MEDKIKKIADDTVDRFLNNDEFRTFIDRAVEKAIRDVSKKHGFKIFPDEWPENDQIVDVLVNKKIIRAIFYADYPGFVECDTEKDIWTPMIIWRVSKEG